MALLSETSVELLFLLKTMWHGCQYNFNKTSKRYLCHILITKIEDENDILRVTFHRSNKSPNFRILLFSTSI